MEIVKDQEKAYFDFLQDDKGVYGLKIVTNENSRKNVDYILTRPDRVCGIDEGEIILPIPTMFQRLPFGKEKDLFCSGSAESRIVDGVFNVLKKRHNLGDFGDLEPDNKEEKKKFCKRWFGIKRSAQNMANAKLNTLYNETIPEHWLKTIRKFPIKRRGRIYLNFAKDGEYAVQLATTFPVLAAYIYSFYNPDETVKEARSLVREGCKLRDVSSCVGMPLSLRKISAAVIKHVFSSAGQYLSTRPDLVDNFMPTTVPKIRTWLMAIDVAYQKTENLDFVDWVARKAMTMGHYKEIVSQVEDISDWAKESRKSELVDKIKPEQFELVKEYLIHDTNNPFQINIPQQLQLKKDPLIPKPFNPNMQVQTVKRLSDEWHAEIAKIQAANLQFPKPWYTGEITDKYSIEPIKDHVELSGVAKEFRNCASTYSSNIAEGNCFLYTVSKKEKKIAMFEILRGNPPTLGQIKGPFNKKVEPHKKTIVQKWLNRRKQIEGNGWQPEKPEQNSESPFQQDVEDPFADAPF